MMALSIDDIPDSEFRILHFFKHLHFMKRHLLSIFPIMLLVVSGRFGQTPKDATVALATVVSTKVLTPRQAVAWAAFWNLVGALTGTAVAKTISAGLVEANVVTSFTVLSALLSAIVWGLFTWWLGLPSSSSHALIGGLCGSALATANGKWSVLIWSVTDARGAHAGLWPKVVLPMFTSPLIGKNPPVLVRAMDDAAGESRP